MHRSYTAPIVCVANDREHIVLLKKGQNIGFAVEADFSVQRGPNCLRRWTGRVLRSPREVSRCVPVGKDKDFGFPVMEA